MFRCLLVSLFVNSCQKATGDYQFDMIVKTGFYICTNIEANEHIPILMIDEGAVSYYAKTNLEWWRPLGRSILLSFSGK